MRETFHLSGKKVYTEDSLEEMVKKVRARYPNATAEGSLGHYVFIQGDVIVAEAWMHKIKPGWWLRIKEIN